MNIKLSKSKVSVVGSVNTDLVTYVNQLPIRGQTIFGRQFAEFGGGKGANQAVAAARAGSLTSFYGAVGSDSYGSSARSRLEQEGIGVEGLLVLSEQSSGVALIIVEEGGENQIVVVPGANQQFGIEDLSLPSRTEGVLLLQNEIAPLTTFSCAKFWHRKGARVVWNIAPEIKSLPPDDVLAATEFVIVNEIELSALVNQQKPPANLDEIVSLVNALMDHYGGIPLRNLIVTMGVAGSLWAQHIAEGVLIKHQHTLPVKVLDTVGAGDCFCGVFAAALATGLPTETALRRASVAATLSVQYAGAQSSMPAYSVIDESLDGFSDKMSTISH